MKLSKTEAINSYNYFWLLKRIFPYIKPYMGRIIIGFLIAIPLGMIDGVTAFSIKPYMDYVVGKQDWIFHIFNHEFTLRWQVFAYIIPFGVVAFAAFQGVLRYLNSYISKWTSTKITNSVKIDLFARLLTMDTKFFDENSSGIILARYLNDPATASNGIVEKIKAITVDFCSSLGLIAVMVWSSWQLAFVGVFILCIAFIPVSLIRNLIRDASNKNLVVSGSMRTNLNETYSGNRTMTAYQLQNRQQKLFEGLIRESWDISMHVIKRSAWMSPLMYLIASFGIAAVLAYGTRLITQGQITAGSFASFVASLLLLYKPVKGLGSTLTSIQGLFVAMGRIFELFDLFPEIQDKENAVEFKGLEREIKLNDVCFEYRKNRPVLKHVNLTVPKGQTCAIVGNSGGGKSTLVNLVSRFYDVQSGSITFDDVDIRDLTLDSIRKNIAIVFQDNFLYSGTIRENIMMGNYHATPEQLEQALDAAYLNETIEALPEGLDTDLAERGVNLSDGQRQRIAIARAMLKDAPIVILDEATSALDNKSEAIVQKALDNLIKNKTVFVIAHRLSTIKNSDRIVVLNEGTITEQGTHDELIAIQDGDYRTLYNMQFRKQEKEEVQIA